MTENDARSVRNELNALLDSTSHVSSADTKEKLILQVIEWAKRNPNHLEYLVDLSLGRVSDTKSSMLGGNRLFIKALGKLGNPNIIPSLKQVLREYDSKKIVFLFAKEVFSALIELNCIESQKAIEDLLKTPKKSILALDFVNALEENPRITYLPLVVRLAEEGLTYKLDLILVYIVQKNKAQLLELLENKNKHVKQTTLDAIKILDIELEGPILDNLREIVYNEKESLLVRSTAADILKKNNVEVPARFRDKLRLNVSDNLKRFTEGILFPGKRDELWAIEEIVNLRNQSDTLRITLRYMIQTGFATVKIWQGYFWDVFNIGFQFSRTWIPWKKYKVRAITRATSFESKPVSLDFLLNNLDIILESFVRQYIELRGSEYQQIISTLNNAIKHDKTITSKGQQTWELDPEKVDTQTEKEQEESPLYLRILACMFSKNIIGSHYWNTKYILEHCESELKQSEASIVMFKRTLAYLKYRRLVTQTSRNTWSLTQKGVMAARDYLSI